MPVRSLKQGSFFDPRLAAPECVQAGTVPWLLANYRDVLCPRWLVAGWRGSGRRGRCAWPASVLMALLVLRWLEEGTSRIGAMRRAATDITWRAAMGLVIGGPTPSDRTMRDFEAFLRERDPHSDLPRYLLLFEHVTQLAAWSSGSLQARWAMDSTPQYCYGAVLDTVRLLGDGLRMLAHAYSRATGTPVLVLARQWNLPLLLAKSTKGFLAIDWRNREERSRVVTELAADATRVVEIVRAELGRIEEGPRKRVLIARCDALLAVIEQDLEGTPDGRLVIAQRVAQNRVISITDPEARHGRKSKSQTFHGFKVNVLGDIVGGLIVAVSATAGNGHDAPAGHELIARARRLRLEIKTVLADTAYGGIAERHELSVVHHITLIAPPPPVGTRSDAFQRREFHVDFTALTATCPNGITTSTLERVEDRGQPHLRFRWDASDCTDCPLRDRCLRTARRASRAQTAPEGPSAKPVRRRNRLRTTGRVLDLHPLEREQRAARAAWEDPEVRRRYRDRTQCERLVSLLVRHGARQARAWGMEAANLQVHAIAMRCNLEILAKNLAKALDQAARARQAA